jgi:hypothetical protein
VGEFSSLVRAFTLRCQFEVDNGRPNSVLGTFLHGKSNELFLTKNGLGYILGELITNSSGHPASKPHLLHFLLRKNV